MKLLTHRNKAYLATLVSKRSGLPIDACYDIIDEVVTQITELQYGNSEYLSVEQIVIDYLDLPASYSLFFIE